jgi:hypothetical protein
MIRSRFMHSLATAALLGALAACSTPKKPPEDQISKYIGDHLPPYLSIRSISTSFEQASAMGGSALPAGSWRVTADLRLRTAEDLYAITAQAQALRTDFAAAVSKAEGFRIARIRGVEAFAAKLGLMKDPQMGPMPALPVALATHKGDELPDQVTLLAEPEGAGWKFTQAGPQTLDTSKSGAPFAALKADNPTLTLVLQGSDEAASYRARQADFLAQLKRLPPF